MVAPVSSFFARYIVPNLLPAVGTAFMAMSRPMVAGTFRIKDEFDFAKIGLKSNPGVVIQRELISTFLTGFFSLVSGLVVFPMAKARNWNKGVVSFFVAVMGAFLGEYISRAIAYKNLKKEALSQPTNGSIGSSSAVQTSEK